MQWNIKRFYARLPHIHQAIDAIIPDVLCFQESWLKPHNNAKLKGFQEPARRDRVDRQGGGVMVFVRQGIPFSATLVNTCLEACAVQLHLPNQSICVCSLYLPPDLSNKNIPCELNNLIGQLPKPFLVCLDSNAHHTLWGSDYTDRRGRIINELITNNDIGLLNTTEPTYIHSNGTLSHIDLSLCSQDLLHTAEWRPHHDTLHSDHFPVIIHLGIECPILELPPKWKLSEADWNKYKLEIKLPANFTDPSSACEGVKNSILLAASTSIPCSPSTFNFRYSKMWWNNECSAAQREKNRAWHQYKKHRGNMKYWIAFKKLQAKCRNVILKAKAASWAKYLSSITAKTSSQEVWRKVRAIRGGSSFQTVSLTSAGEIINKPNEVANALAKHFNTVYNESSVDVFFQAHKAAIESQPFTFMHGVSQPYNDDFTMAELRRALSHTSSNATGPDTIPFIFLQQIPELQQVLLLSFYNYVWNHGFPKQWGQSILIPILKPGKLSTSPDSYRLIALTNCMCKVMERMVNRRLQYILESKNVLKPYQSGFRLSHSTLDPLTVLQSDASNALQNKQFCIAVFLDINKAFDTVWHRGLIDQLQNIDLQGNLPVFIQSFLTSRTFSVRIHNTFSSTYSTSKGVPQGSVISPTLFSIAINNVFEACPVDIRYSLYADDGAFWTTTNDLAEGLNQTQLVLDYINQWTHQSGMQFSHDKTKVMIFSNKRKLNPQPLSLNGQPVKYVTSYKFLGMWFDKKLTWKPHILNLISRCQKDLRLLRVVSHCKWGADLASIRQLYLSLLRPKIEYGDFLYSTAASSTLKMLARVQFAAARTILGALKCTPCNALEAEAELMPLQILSRLHSAAYAGRVLAIPNHPVAVLLRNSPFNSLNYTSKIPSPAVCGMLQELNNLTIMPCQVPIVSLSDRLKVHSFQCSYNLHIANKDDLSASQWKTQYIKLSQAHYTEHEHIFCDGSATSSYVGSAVWSEKINIMAKLPATASIYTAELYAIYIAITYARMFPKRYVIFSDSLSSLHSLDHPTAKSHYLVHKILKVISEIPTNLIVLEWLPSHQGIEGNENADKLAKASHNLQIMSTNYIAARDYKKTIHKYYLSCWQSEYTNSNSKLIPIKPNINNITAYDILRRHQVAYTRLRLGTTLITHKHLFENLPRPLCSWCGETSISVEHVLIECAALESAREDLKYQCTKLKVPCTHAAILGEERLTNTVVKYLRQTSILPLI